MPHYATFLMTHALLGSGLLSAGILGKIVRCWINHRTALLHEAESTRKLVLAIRDTTSDQRAAVVRACAELEAASNRTHDPGSRVNYRDDKS